MLQTEQRSHQKGSYCEPGFSIGCDDWIDDTQDATRYEYEQASADNDKCMELYDVYTPRFIGAVGGDGVVRPIGYVVRAACIQLFRE